MTMPTVKMLVLLMLQAPTTSAEAPVWRDIGKGICENGRYNKISSTFKKDGTNSEPLEVCQQRCVESSKCLSIYHVVNPVTNYTVCTLYSKAFTKAEKPIGAPQTLGEFVDGQPVDHRCWTRVLKWRDNGKGVCENARMYDPKVMISYFTQKDDMKKGPEPLAWCQQRCVGVPSCLSIYREVHPINNEVRCILYKKAYTKAEDTGGTIGGKPVQDRCWTLAWVRLQDTGCFAWTKLGETYPESKTKGWMAKENKPVAATVLESWKKVDFLKQALRMKLVKNTGCPIEGQITSHASFVQTLWVAFIAVSCAVMQ